MTNFMHVHLNEIGIPTVLETSVVQIESLLFKSSQMLFLGYKINLKSNKVFIVLYSLV